MSNRASNFQYADAKVVAHTIGGMPEELTNLEIKGALINALERISRLEAQVTALKSIVLGR